MDLKTKFAKEKKEDGDMFNLLNAIEQAFMQKGSRRSTYYHIRKWLKDEGYVKQP